MPIHTRHASQHNNYLKQKQLEHRTHIASQNILPKCNRDYLMGARYRWHSKISHLYWINIWHKDTSTLNGYCLSQRAHCCIKSSWNSALWLRHIRYLLKHGNTIFILKNKKFTRCLNMTRWWMVVCGCNCHTLPSFLINETRLFEI